MPGLKSRRKGDRMERAVVDLLQQHGVEAQRVPLSGSSGGEFGGDVRCRIWSRGFLLECKHRANGFRSLYEWLDSDADALVVRADRQEPLLIVPLKDALALLSEGK